MSYRTIEDLHCIRRTARKSRSGVVVGGGLLGLECANALMHLGLETHVVEFAPGLMGVQLDAEGSSMLRRKIENLGVQVHTSRSTERIVAGDAAGDKAALRLDFSDGDSLHTDMVVFSAGIRPRDELARDCGLTIGARGGIVIDERCRTSDSAIYAIGECALYRGRVFGLVAPGYRMAETVAAQLCGTSRSFQGADMSTRLKLLGVDVGGIGDAHGRTEASLAFAYSDRKSQTYRRLVTSADRKRLLGAVLVGDCDSYQTLLQYYRNGLELPEDPESLIVPHRGTESGLSADLLPRRATLCGCHNVSKGEVLDAIDGGARSLAAVQAATRAGSGCGGCAGLIDDVLRREMSVPGSGEEAQQSGTADGVRHRGTVAVSPEPISAA